MRRIGTIATWSAIAAALGTIAIAGVTMASALASAMTASSDGRPLAAAETAALMRQGLSPARAQAAIDAQSEVARADLVGKAEAALGEAYGGAWFEPETALLHIGVTAAVDRRTAETVISETGVAAAVVTTVRSTWTQLLAAQRQWHDKLAGLLAHQQVKTALDPQANAVIVTLSSEVPASERAALEAAASASNVRMLIEVVPASHLSFQPSNGTCKAFTKNEAFCSKPLASGVSIEAQTKQGRCTSGPLATGKDGERGRTFALTAGHCISYQGGNGQNWAAFTTAGAKSVFGPAIASVYGQGNGDYANILIEQPGNWSEPGNIPVFALTAQWKATASTISFPIKGEQTPTVGFQDCHEGQTTGQSCGQIKALQAEVPYGDGVTVVGMVENKGANLNGGDSGGPFLFIESNNEVLMEGILSGGENGRQGAVIFFTPLQTALKAQNLELLTTANETRRGPYWRVGGARLSSGTKQINLQVKGTSSLKSKVVGVAATVECGFATSEGAALEGNGPAQGQDKGALKFSECKVLTPTKCAVEPVKTVNTKSHLVTYEGSQSKYADLFEPQQGEVLATVKIINGTEKCAITGEFPLKGSVAAEIIPKEAETQEGLLNFPATPIEKVFLENKEKPVKLTLGGEPAKLTAAFSAKLATGEPFGVFGT